MHPILELFLTLLVLLGAFAVPFLSLLFWPLYFGYLGGFSLIVYLKFRTRDRMPRQLDGFRRSRITVEEVFGKDEN